MVLTLPPEDVTEFFYDTAEVDASDLAHPAL